MKHNKANALVCIIALMLFFLAGCATATNQQDIVSSSDDQIIKELLSLHKSYVEAVKNLKLVSDDLIDIALFETGFLRESLGTDLQNIPGEALSILNRYEAIARKAKLNGVPLNDYEKGQIIGMRWRFLYRVVREAVHMVGPQILDALKIVL